jgi:hypothetical protein
VIGETVGFTWSGIARSAIDVSTLSDTDGTSTALFGSKKFIAGKQTDPGEIQFTLLQPNYLTSIDAAATTITATLGDGSAFAGSAFFQSMSVNNPNDERVELEVTMKCTGAWSATISTQVP